MNRLLSLDELNVANITDYAATAIHVASNKDKRRVIQDILRRAGRDQFEDSAVVSEWQEWLLGMAT